MDSHHEEMIAKGWVLYYSEEGYPYYYNDSTGESEWAPTATDNVLLHDNYGATDEVYELHSPRSSL